MSLPGPGGRLALGLLMSLGLGGCLASQHRPPAFLRLDSSGVQVREQRLAWNELTHLAQVQLPASEGPFQQLVVSGAQRSLTLCASFAAPPSPGSTADLLAGHVAVPAETLTQVRELICQTAGLELLETTPQGPVYGRTPESPRPQPLTSPREFP